MLPIVCWSVTEPEPRSRPTWTVDSVALWALFPSRTLSEQTRVSVRTPLQSTTPGPNPQPNSTPTPTTTAATARPTPGGEPAFTPPSEKQKLGLLSRPGHPRPGYAPLRGPGRRPQGQQRPEHPRGQSTQVVFQVQGLPVCRLWQPRCQKGPSPFESVRWLGVQQRLRPHQREAQETASAQTGHGWLSTTDTELLVCSLSEAEVI